jgi:hypothetical protein
MLQEPKFAPTSLASIKAKVLAFHTKMNAITTHCNAQPDPALHIKQDDLFLQFYIDRTALQNINEIANLPGCNSLVVFFGMENTPTGEEKMTTCFLGVDANNEILDAHRKPYVGANGRMTTKALDGEENWPPPPYNIAGASTQTRPGNCFSLQNTEAELNYFFRP